MKIKFLLIVLFTINLSLVAQEFKTPVEYLTYINKEHVQISKSTWKYTSAVAHSKSARRIDASVVQWIVWAALKVTAAKLVSITKQEDKNVNHFL